MSEQKTDDAAKAAAAASLGRRELLAGAGTVVGMALAGSAWAGEHDKHSGHVGHSGHAGQGAAKANSKVVRAADECTRTGRLCFIHCLETFRDGDTTMADCAWEVKQMMHVCEALSAMASYDSPHLEAMGAVCISVCEDCERQCRIHEDHQQECKDCADACAVLVREIRALSA